MDQKLITGSCVRGFDRRFDLIEKAETMTVEILMEEKAWY
jgi:hypothetical protein